jgi:uncharacterized protein (DUF58 family)
MGRAIVVLAAALVGAGLAFDLPALYEPGVGLALLAVAASVWVKRASGEMRLRHIAPRPSVIEDEPLELRFELERGRVPVPAMELRDPLLARPVPVHPGSGGSIGFTASWRRRGRKALGPTTLAVADPLGISERSVAAEGAASVLVLPKLEPVVAGAAGGAGLGALGLVADGAAARRGAAAIEVEIDGLRPYRRGSPASRIHWRTVARTGEMVERRLEAGAGARPLVVLDSSQPTDDDALDRAVRAAASLTHRLALAGGCGLVLSGAPRPLEIDSRLRGWPVAHAGLALVTAGGRSPVIRGSRARSAVVFWVTAGNGSPPRRLEAGATYLVAPLESAASDAALFTVAGCAGRRIRSRSASPRVEERAA